MKLNDFTHFLDSNIIIGYATDFEDIHDKCQQYFEMDIVKKTGSRVYTEVGRLKARRRKLHNDLKTYLSKNLDIEKYKPSVPVKGNDLRHLKELLKEILTVKPYKALNYLDRKVRTIEAGIREAFDKITKPFITLYNYTILEHALNKWINNMSDSCILSDAVCWAEKNDKLIFCTNDNKDYLSNKEDIYYAICSVRPYDYRDLPIEIVGIKEIIP